MSSFTSSGATICCSVNFGSGLLGPVWRSKKINPVQEVYKELSHHQGRDSPESGSLYSDYESGHQYEQV